MKTFFTTFLFLLFFQIGFSQNWQLLGTDPIGDGEISGATDFTSAAYAVDETQDSLWFMFSFDTTSWNTSGDFGLALGVDTNLITTDGIDWGGDNQSMKTDIQYVFTRNGVFQTDITNNGTNPINAEIYESATFDTLILRFPLAAFDEDGMFNIIAGVGSFTLEVGGALFEEIPDDTFFSIDWTTSITTLSDPQYGIKIYPNPGTSSDVLQVEADQEIVELQLIDITGRHVANSDQAFLSLSGIEEGIYFLGIQLKGQNTSIFKKVIIR